MTTVDKKICNNCLSAIDADAKFCGQCGTKYEDAPSQQEQVPDNILENEQVANIEIDTSIKQVVSQERVPIGLKQLLFSPKGRISRKTYFKGMFFAIICWGGYSMTLFLLASLTIAIFNYWNEQIAAVFGGTIAFIGFLGLFGFLWSGLVITAKRYHDLGISYIQAVFMSFIPFYAIKLQYDLFFTPGKGPNQYGDYSQ